MHVTVAQLIEYLRNVPGNVTIMLETDAGPTVVGELCTMRLSYNDNTVTLSTDDPLGFLRSGAIDGQ